MPAPENIRQLVKRFEENLDSYRSNKYNEAQLRREFLDPFFEALGWDVFNKQGYAEAYKEVIHEDSLEVEGATKAPDYAFRVGGQRKYFVEAKKPSVNIQFDIHPAFQLRRYSWSAILPLGVLSDFEEFAIYDCRNKPDKKDKASTGRVTYYSFREYVEKWDEIADIFSREAVLKGSFDKYAEGMKGKKGTAEVDDAFLAEIERWRELLARNFALRNPSLTTRELNYAVQLTIDRIIFLRICEDRGIEPYEKLKNAITPAPPALSGALPKSADAKNSQRDGSANLGRDGEGLIYAELVRIFQQADDRYNSGLFHFKDEKNASSAADSLTLSLSVDDKVLREILGSLYYPESPYVFSEIPSDILGQVYERFLGKVIRLTAGHQAKVEEKPEVRKAGGVYYTPTYIVEYIVKNTVGRIVNPTYTPREVSKIKILDPACGSGTFPLGAFQYLLDWHLKWYMENDPEKWSKEKSPVIFESDKGWMLTTSEKKRILLNNIYGVDIDPQAVEVTKLSLLLKVLEGESEQTIGSQLSLIQERALPDLSNNIKCGNSLIGPDYYEGQQLTMDFADEEERYRVNAFDWKAEFSQVFIQGGFDVVIGNPPWGADLEKNDENYIKQSYEVGKSSAIDSYALFIEQGIKVLRESGLIGFITPDTFLRKSDLLPVRSFLLNNTAIVELIETGPVFSQVRDTWCLVFTAAKEGLNGVSRIRHRKISRFITAAEERLAIFARKNWTVESEVSQSVWLKNPDLIVGYLASEVEQKIIDKIEKHSPLGQQQEKYKISRGEEGSKFALTPDPSSNFFMVIPKDIERYSCEDGVRINENTLTVTKKDSLYDHPKVWIIRIQKMRWMQRIVCTYDGRINSAGMKTLQIVISPTDKADDLQFLSAVLSSRLINFWCINYLADDMNQTYLSRIPIPTINFSDAEDKARHEKIVSLVERMLELHKTPSARFAGTSPKSSSGLGGGQGGGRTPQEKERVTREIEATDKSIDRLVYELYGLTEDEIKIVEDKK